MSTQNPRTSVVVLFGGQSAEHDVSCVTAAHVLRAIDTTRFTVIPIGITRDGQWRTIDVSSIDPTDGRLKTDGAPTHVDVLTSLHDSAVVMPLMHGPLGEDGTMQGLLEVLGLPYVGSGVLSSALCMDKAMTKTVLASHHVPQVRYEAHHASRLNSELQSTVAKNLGLPLFVKPANMGSSVGVHKVNTLEEFAAAVEDASSYDELIMCEEAINGREIEVSVLGNLSPRASVPGEIEPGDDFYDYDDKYVTSAATLHIPARLTAEQAAQVRDMAIRCYTLLRCEGMARVDFFFEEDGRGFLLNEVNTIPGFTPISMYPKLWQASGLTYEDLVNELIELAIERHSRRPRNTSH